MLFSRLRGNRLFSRLVGRAVRGRLVGRFFSRRVGRSFSRLRRPVRSRLVGRFFGRRVRRIFSRLRSRPVRSRLVGRSFSRLRSRPVRSRLVGRSFSRLRSRPVRGRRSGLFGRLGDRLSGCSNLPGMLRNRPRSPRPLGTRPRIGPRTGDVLRCRPPALRSHLVLAPLRPARHLDRRLVALRPANHRVLPMRLDRHVEMVVMVGVVVGRDELPPHSPRPKPTRHLIERSLGRARVRKPALVVVREAQALAPRLHLVDVDRQPPRVKAHPSYPAHPIRIGPRIEDFRDSRGEEVRPHPRERHSETAVAEQRRVVQPPVHHPTQGPIHEDRGLHALLLRSETEGHAKPHELRQASLPVGDRTGIELPQRRQHWHRSNRTRRSGLDHVRRGRCIRRQDVLKGRPLDHLP